MTTVMAFILLLRVFDRSGESVATRRAAIETADVILRQADIAPRWVDCSTDSRAASRPACTAPLAEDELVVRITPGPRDDAPAGQRTLGYSHVKPHVGGTLATVFSDRVGWLAASAGFRRSTLLGRAVAHEVGHLLIGTNEHSASGLMRPVWTATELTRDERADWTFTTDDRERLQRSRLGDDQLRLAERSASPAATSPAGAQSDDES
jgi:hypothetical protein